MSPDPWTVLYDDESGGKTVVVTEFSLPNEREAAILLSEDSYPLYDLTQPEVDLLGLREIRMRESEEREGICPGGYWHEDGDGPVELLGYWLETDYAFEQIVAAREAAT